MCDVTDQRNLGMSMKIERSSLDQVRQRFEMNKKKKEEKKKEYDIEERLKEIKEEVNAFLPVIRNTMLQGKFPKTSESFSLYYASWVVYNPSQYKHSCVYQTA